MAASQNEFRVNDKAPGGLKLRSEPNANRSNIVAVIACTHPVTKLEESVVADWWKVQTTLHGRTATGFVNKEYLSPANEVAPQDAPPRVAAVHLPTAGLSVTRANAWHACPLTEVPPVIRDENDGPAEKVSALRQIIDWLDVERSPRYLARGRTTFCNIYAYDYCYLAKAYLPHIWWTQQSLLRFESGQSVLVAGEVPVEELSSNALNSWFKEWGAHFGWRRTFDLTELQEAANEGQVCITVGRAKPQFYEGCGHIVAVVPETGSFRAFRQNGQIVKTVQSQAGPLNRRYVVQRWWDDGTFADFGHWIHQ